MLLAHRLNPIKRRLCPVQQRHTFELSYALLLGEVVAPDVVLVNVNPCNDIQMLAFF